MTTLALDPELTEAPRVESGSIDSGSVGSDHAETPRVTGRPARGRTQPAKRRVVPTRPVGKPANCPAPVVGRRPRTEARACVVTAHRPEATGGLRSARLESAAELAVPRLSVEGGEWRLTDRGIAAVLTLAVLLTLAALLCIGLRAVEVTSVDHHAGAAPASSVAAPGAPRG